MHLVLTAFVQEEVWAVRNTFGKRLAVFHSRIGKKNFLSRRHFGFHQGHLRFDLILHDAQRHPYRLGFD
jgi:hypothetical protein